MRLNQPRHLRMLAGEILGEIRVILKRPRTQQPNHILPAEHLFLEQLLRDEPHLALLLGEQILALLVRLVDDALHLDVDVLGRLLGEGFLHLVPLVVVVVDVADFLRHTPLCYHEGSHVCDFAEVVRRTRGDGVEVEFLGDTATERHGHAVHELVDVHEVGVAGGEVLGVAKGALATGDDGDLEEGVGPLEVPAADGVAGFVVGDGLLLFGLEDERLLLETADDALDGGFEVDHCD